jgi:hypothetical protein
MTARVSWDSDLRQWMRDQRRYTWRPVNPWWRRPAWWLAISVSGGAVLGQYQAVKTWTPLQRAYGVSYAWSAMAPTLGLTDGSYNLLHIRDRAGTHIAIDADVNAALPADDTGHLQPSDAAVRAGARRLEWTAGSYPHELVYGFLRAAIYRDSNVALLLNPALVGAQVVLLVALLLSLALRTSQKTFERIASALDWNPLEPLTPEDQFLPEDARTLLASQLDHMSGLIRTASDWLQTFDMIAARRLVQGSISAQGSGGNAGPLEVRRRGRPRKPRPA